MRTFGRSPKIITLVTLLLLASGQTSSQSRATGQRSLNPDEMYLGRLAGSSRASLARHLALKPGARRLSPHLARLLERRSDLFESRTWVNDTLDTPTQGQSDSAPSQTALGAQPESVPPGFSFVDLGTLGGPQTLVNDMNETGQVVGVSITAEGAFHAFLWDKGIMTDLGVLEGSEDSFAIKINDAGQVLGFSFSPVPCPPDDIDFPPGVICVEPRAWVWEKGVMTRLGQSGAEIWDPVDINERGEVIGNGFARDPFENPIENPFQPLLWGRGVLTALGTLPDGFFASASDINDRGQVVGTSAAADGATHAFLWEEGVMTDLGLINGSRDSNADLINERGQVLGDFSNFPPFRMDLSLWDHDQVTILGLGAAFAVPEGFNVKGQVVGSRAFRTGPFTTGPFRAFFWDNGETTDLTFPGGTTSRAFAINQRGQVAGSSRTARGERHAFLWDRGVLTDLGIPQGGSLSAAVLINESGRLAGQWVTASGEVRAFILTPTQ